MVRAPALALFVGLALVGSACSEAPGCATDADCAGELACIEQRCRAVVRTDGASIDAGPHEDAGPRDASLDDAGPPDCVVGDDTGCGARRECRALQGADACNEGAPGRCTDADGAGPECGCDGWSYADTSRRMGAGVGFAHDGFCTCAECASGGLCDRGWSCASSEGVCVEPPATCADAPGEWAWTCGDSSLVPRYQDECQRLMDRAEAVSPVPIGCGAPPTRTGCCYEDDDCIPTGVAAEQRCYGSSGCDAVDGACLEVPGGGDCYGARDCPAGYRCVGATVVACDPSLASLGRCELRTEGLR